MLLIKTDLMPKRFDAMFLGFGITLIRPKHARNTALIAHEQEHSNQFNKFFLLFPLRYMCSRQYRLEYEARAYAAQVNVAPEYLRPEKLKSAAQSLAQNYDLDITPHAAWFEIRNYMYGME
jgi:hypothetical protein